MGGVVTTFFGTVLYRYCFHKETRKWVGTAMIAFWLSIIAGFWCRLVGFARPGEFRYLGFRSMTLGWTAALVLFLGLLALRRRAFPRTLIWFGKISYSIYLMHPFIFALFRTHMDAPWAFPAVLACSVVFACFTYTIIEAPFLMLQHRLFPRPPVVPPPETSMSAL